MARCNRLSHTTLLTKETLEKFDQPLIITRSRRIFQEPVPNNSRVSLGQEQPRMEARVGIDLTPARHSSIELSIKRVLGRRVQLILQIPVLLAQLRKLRRHSMPCRPYGEIEHLGTEIPVVFLRQIARHLELLMSHTDRASPATTIRPTRASNQPGFLPCRSAPPLLARQLASETCAARRPRQACCL